MLNILLLIVFFVLAQIMGAVVSLLYLHCGGLPELSAAAQGWGMIVSFGILWGVLRVLHLVRKNPFAIYEKHPLKVGYTPIVGFLALSVGTTLFLHPFSLDDGGTTDQFLMLTHSWGGMILLCVVGPIVEELVFREGILRQLLLKGYSPWLAVAFSALCFGMVHLNPAQMIPAMIMGGALGALYLLTGNLRLCALAHVLNNLLAVLSLRYPEVEAGLSSCPVAFLFVGGVLLGIVGVVGIGRYFRVGHSSSL